MLNHLNDPLNLFAQVARSDGPRPGFQSQRDNWATSGGGDLSAARFMLPRVLGTSGGQGRPQQDGAFRWPSPRFSELMRQLGHLQGVGDVSAARLMLPRVLGTSGGQGRPQQDGGGSRARRNEPRESPPNKSVSRALWVGHEPEPVQRFEGAEKS